MTRGWLVAFCACAVALLSLSAAAHGAGESQAPPDAPSSEAVALALLPLLPGDADLPAPLTVSGHAVLAPADLALQSSGAVPPRIELAAIESDGIRLRVYEALFGDFTGAAVLGGEIKITVYDTSAEAQANAARRLRDTRVESYAYLEPIALGDGGAAYRTTVMLALTPLVGYDLVWSRGPLLIDLSVFDGRTDFGEAQPLLLANTVDQKLTGYVSPPASAATGSTPSSEAQRLAAMLVLASVVPAENQIPGGLFCDPFNFDTYSVVAELSNVANPQARLHTLADEYGRIAGSGGDCESDGDVPYFDFSASLDGTAAGAALDAATLDAAPGEAAISVSPPVSLGDSTFAFRVTNPDQFDPFSDEGPVYGVVLQWTHGPVVLRARYYMLAAQFDMDTAVRAAQAVETAYNASSVPAFVRSTP